MGSPTTVDCDLNLQSGSAHRVSMSCHRERSRQIFRCRPADFGVEALAQPVHVIWKYSTVRRLHESSTKTGQ